MEPKPKKLKTKKYIRDKKRTLIQAGDDASKHIDKHLISRFANLALSWRFVVSWLLLSVLMVWVLAIQTRSLSSHYTQLLPKPGGTYIEGIQGPLTNMNPLYATTTADKAVSKLIFSSLMKYNVEDQLVGDLAESITSDEKASIFTVKLKPDLKWHDGEKLTAHDVVFTVQTIQDPSSRSPLRRSLEGVSVEAVDENTVKFTLPASFSPFPSVLTFGIIPKHILGDLSPTQLRSSSFNGSQPIGTGPFVFQRIVHISGVDPIEKELQVQLTAYEDYHFGRPQLDAFTFWVAPTSERLAEIFNDGQLSGVTDITFDQIDVDMDVAENIFNQTSGVFLFYKNTNELLKDTRLRRALTQAIDVSELIRELDQPVQRIYGPLLPDQIDYDSDDRELEYNFKSAAKRLDELGWKLNVDGIREKNGQKLEFKITTQEGVKNYLDLAEGIKAQLANIGIIINIETIPADSFADVALYEHSYQDMLIYGINIGVDPDVYAFWHSSQTDRNSTIRLNLSEYRSDAADEALESGRSRVETDIRQNKYHDFLNIWRSDAPALAIYQPTFSYFTLKHVHGPAGNELRSPTERFRDVHLWTTLTSRIRYYQEQRL
ncbi:peptide ABC transporter substrate-binding protein [Candidatus Saccharibacteria bacterium]|nr:peptide ABC transporter substrate-binding protein [Candidatus Saccharibacteria bacterium]